MFYEDATRYDAVYGSFSEDIPFYVETALEADGPVCELACGTGRVGIPLLREGIDYVGIDISPVMIDAARSKAQRRLGAAAVDRFFVADMTRFVRPGAFAAIFIPLHTLSHITGSGLIASTLENVRCSLRPKGVLAFSIHNPTPDWTDRDPEALYPVTGSAGWNPPAGTAERVRYDRTTRVAEVTWFFDDGSTAEFVMRLFRPREIDEIVTAAGFQVLGHWGWYDRSPFRRDSGTQVIVCCR